MSTTVELQAPGPYSLGEGAMWDSRLQRLYWIDINESKLAFQQSEEVREFDLPGMPGTLLLTSDVNQILLALDCGLVIFDLKTQETKSVLEFPESAELRFNDGKCDPNGRLWVGTMHRDGKEGAGTLYRIDPDFSVQPMLRGVTVSNGICWSSDGSSMYFVDSATREIHGFDFETSKGQISNRRTVAKVPEGWGFPDGMTIDAEGKLWVAHWLGNCVARYDPATGEAVERIEIPTPRVTSAWFGGDQLKTLFITTAKGSQDGGWTDLEKFPETGAVFAAKPGASGVAASVFGIGS